MPAVISRIRGLGVAAAFAGVLTTSAPAQLGAPLGTIDNPAPNTGDRFGQALSAREQLLAVGAPTDETGGRVHLYTLPSTTRTAVLQPPNSVNQIQFGRAVAVLSSTRIAVGAPRVSISNIPAGVVYIHASNGGPAVRTIVNPDPTGAVGGGGLDAFGTALALAGNVLAVGAFGNDLSGIGSAGIDAGSVYLYNAADATYPFLREIPCPDPVSLAYFGASLAGAGNDLVVGAPGGQVGFEFGAGRAYVITTGTGAVRLRLEEPVPNAGAAFGQAVAGAGNLVAVGAPFSSRFGKLAGATYVWNVSPSLPGGAPQLVAAIPGGGSAVLFTANHLAVTRGESIALYPRTATTVSTTPAATINRPGAGTSEWGLTLAETPGRLHVGDRLFFVSPQGPDVGRVFMYQLEATSLPTGFLLR